MLRELKAGGAGVSFGVGLLLVLLASADRNPAGGTANAAAAWMAVAMFAMAAGLWDSRTR